MKKKNIAMSKKLSFSKETIAALNNCQQQLIAGGARRTELFTCISRVETCGTFPGPTRPCELCPTN
ncbi:class I lanthipeptide [Chitinophaga eiseniae]|nr:class I lanthipeptide [Chitinophaga eiseniae]